MDTSVARKLGRNEALFRQVNERLRELGESFSVVAEHADFICECSDERCAQQIRLTLDEYGRVRADPRWFVIRRGHERPEIETIAWDVGADVVVVQKHEELAGEAIADDPRR
jgi:hypothetical protein